MVVTSGSSSGLLGPDGRQEGVRRRRWRQAEGLGRLNKQGVDLVLDAVDLHSSIDDLNQDAPEDGSVEQLPQAGIGLLVGFAWLTEQHQGVVEGLGSVVNLGDGLVLPALRLGLFGGDPLLFSLQDINGYGVAVEQLHEFLLLGGQLM